jgi:hypothetical protein
MGFPSAHSTISARAVSASYEASRQSRFLGCLSEAARNHSPTGDRNYALLKDNPQHPSLHFKKVGKYRSVRIGLRYRALAVDVDNDLL